MRPDYYRITVPVTDVTTAPSTTPGETDITVGTLECFDLIDALCGGDFYLGNALKYLFRAGKKGASRDSDLAKAITYLEQVRKRQQGSPQDPSGRCGVLDDTFQRVCDKEQGHSGDHIDTTVPPTVVDGK